MTLTMNDIIKQHALVAVLLFRQHTWISFVLFVLLLCTKPSSTHFPLFLLFLRLSITLALSPSPVRLTLPCTVFFD